MTPTAASAPLAVVTGGIGKTKVQDDSFASKARKVLPDRAKAVFHRQETEPGSAES